jgi:hypothetical protein
MQSAVVGWRSAGVASLVLLRMTAYTRSQSVTTPARNRSMTPATERRTGARRSTLALLLTGCVALLACAGPAAAATAPGDAAATGHSPVPGVHLPLHTQGRWIVDRRGKRVKLASVNWFGAESAEFVVGGLDRQPLSEIARLIKRGGFNSVRLPWSNQLVEQNPVVPADLLGANPGSRASMLEMSWTR